MDCRGHNVIDFESLEVAVCIGSGGCVAATVLSEISEDVCGKFGLGLAKAKEFVEVVNGVVVIGGLRGGREIAVDRESEGASDGGDRSNDVGTVNAGGVPSIVGTVEGFN